MPATPEIVGAYRAAAGESYAMPTLRRRVAAAGLAETILRVCAIAGGKPIERFRSVLELLYIRRCDGKASWYRRP